MDYSLIWCNLTPRQTLKGIADKCGIAVVTVAHNRKMKDRTKNKSSYRSLPLIPEMRDELMKKKSLDDEMKRVLPKTYNHKWDGYVCVDIKGDLFNPSYVTSHFKSLTRRAGLREIRFHDLRHSCASILIAQGIDIKLIQAWLGHSTVSTTADIYGHIDARSKALCANTIGSAISGRAVK